MMLPMVVIAVRRVGRALRAHRLGSGVNKARSGVRALPWLLVLAFVLTLPVRAEWPQFRGPGAQGIAPAGQVPLEWSAEKNIAWKQPVPGVGLSSPVVSDGRVFVTAALRDENGSPGVFLFSFRADTGRLESRTLLFPTGELPPGEGHERNVAANATIIAEGDRLYGYVGHHGAICLDREGKVIWRTNRLRFDPVPPNGTSPIIAGDLLVYVADCATAAFVMALDKHTGAVRWRVPRVAPGKMKFTFGAPLAIEAAGRRQIVVMGASAITAHDPADGREIWRVRTARDSAGPQPVFAHGLLFVSAGYLRTDLFAIRPDGTGDVTDTHVMWRVSKGAPLTPALVAVGSELFGVNDAGIATCWEAKTGRVLWQERLPGNYSAAPVAAEGRIYFLNDEGLTTVVRAAREFSILAKNPLGEMTLASPAVSDGAIFIRTLRHVWRLGLKQETAR